MHPLQTLSRDAMVILKLGLLFAVLSDRSVQGILLETYGGVEVSVTPSLLFLNNQSDYFFFEVKSCGKVNITMVDDYLTNSIKVALSRSANGSVPYACYLNSCTQTAMSFSTADYCSEHKTFWVNRSLNESTAKVYFGEGCTIGKGNLTSYPVSRMDSMYADPPFYNLQLTSTESAKWKLGSSACQPDTTTEAPTTTSTSVVQCSSGKNGGSSTSMLSLTTVLLILVSASL